ITLLLALGCGGKAGDTSGPASAPREADSVAAAKGDRAAILASLSAATHEEVTRRLGPHRASIQIETKVALEGGDPFSFTPKNALEVAGDGAIHVKTENSRREGLELYLIGQKRSLATLYGPLRPADNPEVARLREEAWNPLRVHIELLGRFLAFSPS